MRRNIAAAVIGLWAIVPMSVALAADAYKNRMTRPFHAGDSVAISTTVKVNSLRRFETGRAPSEVPTVFEAAIDGVETIDDVTGKGDPTKLSIKVAKCTKDGKVLIPAGSTLSAENKDGKTKFKIDGKEPAEDVARVLAALVETSKPGAPSADDMIGTDKPQAVGDSWPANADVLAKELSDVTIQLTADQIVGESALTEVSTVDGKPCEVVTTSITADVPQKNPDNTFQVHDLKINIDARETVPVDEASHARTVKLKRSISFKMDAPGMVVTISVDSTKEEKVTELKK